MSILIPVLTAIISASAALAGVYLNSRIQLTLRKEKFDELIYKEKFAIYKKLITHVTATQELLYEMRWSSSSDEEEESAKHNQLANERLAFRLALSRAHFLAPDKVLNAGSKLELAFLLPPKDSKEWFDFHSEIHRGKLALDWAVRNDLGINPVSDNIKSTIEQTHFSFLRRALSAVKSSDQQKWRQ